MSRMCVSTVVILESVNLELCYRPAPISLTSIPTHVIAFCQMPRATCVLTSRRFVRTLTIAVLISAVVYYTMTLDQAVAVASIVVLEVAVALAYHVMI